MEERNDAFIVWTPLHLYNALRYILSNDLVGKCDLFYICQSDGMQKYYHNASETGVFRRVFKTEYKDLQVHQRRWEIIGDAVSPRIYVKHLFDKSAVGNCYDTVFMSVPTRLNDAIIRSNSYKRIVGYDDGTGSYTSNLYDTSLGKKYEFFRKIREKKECVIETVFLNCPDSVLNTDDGLEYRKLVEKPLSNTQIEIINGVFEHDANIDYPRFVFLNQPLEATSDKIDYRCTDKLIVDILSDCKTDAIIRMHPREKDISPYNSFTIDRSDKLWELICADQINDDHVLIGCYSTAQFSPKLLFDKEPWILFTYKLYKGVFSQDQIIKMELMIERLSESYSDRKRIIIANDIDDFVARINIIKKYET